MLGSRFESYVILDQISVSANIRKAISVNWIINKISYQCITTVVLSMYAWITNADMTSVLGDNPTQ